VTLPGNVISYQHVLGLKKDPFSPEPDPACYYASDSFEQRLKVLQGLVRGTDALGMVIGEPGSGKTTLLKRYLAAADGRWKAVRILTDPETATPRTTDTLERGGHPAYVLQDSEAPIVIVDDSHKLSVKELEFLLQEALVPGSTSKIKRLVLFGEPGLDSKIGRLPVTSAAQPAVNKIYLPGLTAKQTGEYLQLRLAAAGYTGENPFNSSAVKDIHQTSGGYPGAVNEIANQWLRIKYSAKEEGQGMKQRFSASPRRVAVWIAAAVIVLGLAAIWYFQDRRPTVSNPPDQVAAKKVFRQRVPMNPGAVEPVVRKKVITAQTATQAAAETKAAQSPAAGASTQPTAEASPQPTAQVPTQPQAEVPIQPAVQASTRTRDEDNANRQIVEPAAPDAAQPKAEALPRSPQIQPPSPAPTPSVAESPAPAVKTAVQRENWLLAQDPESYTIQIMGVYNEQSLLDFIKRNQELEQGEIAYYETLFQGRPWYQLLYGIYPTKQAAQLAADELPENIRRAGPWMRKLAVIQQAIKDRRVQ
jgi:DamX protein